MLRSARCSSLTRALLSRTATISTTAKTGVHHPNAPLDLDPSLQALLSDVDISLARHKARSVMEEPSVHTRRELEVFADRSAAVDGAELIEEDAEDVEPDHQDSRKSPAALFGSQRVGAIVLPLELQNAITRLIEGSDKTILHADAKRLFLNDTETGGKEWDPTYDIRYKNRKQSARHAERDGTAFASIALPAHYSAIFSVLDHLSHRLGNNWVVERLIDWHAGTGSGLWAALNTFQTAAGRRSEEPEIAQSTLLTYLGIEKREGLTTIGKRLLEDVDAGGLSVSWQKSFREEDKVPRTEGGDTLALSAFALSSLPNPLARKHLIKEMWESGADVIVLIDHNNLSGFENIAEAREHLLRMGRKELEDPEAASWPIRGSHVVAPCPHDGACPLYHPGSERLVCGFSQRIQRPAFVRKTKHSGVGHEDVGYSYIAIRRGARPQHMEGSLKVGRFGQVGKRELRKEVDAQMKLPHKVIHEEGVLASHKKPEADLADVLRTEVISAGVDGEELKSEVSQSPSHFSQIDSRSDTEETLRLEAYSWPRLVFAPLKRSGHVILDCCTPEGKIMRHTIPKSQGKQAYYDARKSEWGDIFPHEPKNEPQERHQSTRVKRKDGSAHIKGAHIGKRGVDLTRNTSKDSYGKLAEQIKERKKQLRWERSMSKVD